MLCSIYYFCIASGGKYSHWATGIKGWSSGEAGSHPSYPAVFNSNTSHLLLFIIPGLDKTGLIFQSLQAFLEKTQINLFLPLLPLQESMTANSWHWAELTYRSHSHPEAGQLPLLSQHGDKMGQKWHKMEQKRHQLQKSVSAQTLKPSYSHRFQLPCLPLTLEMDSGGLGGGEWTNWFMECLSNGFSTCTHFQLPFLEPVCWQSIWITFWFFIWKSQCLSILSFLSQVLPFATLSHVSG